MELSINDKIKILQEKIEDLQLRMPAHSIPASMIIELDDLEAELNFWVSQLGSAENNSPDKIQE
jgi:hypothetical protein